MALCDNVKEDVKSFGLSQGNAEVWNKCSRKTEGAAGSPGFTWKMV